MKRIVLLLLPGLLLAFSGVEPVVSTGADGSRQVWYRIVDNGRVINPEPVAPQGPPRAPSDTGVLWVDRNHRYGILQSLAISADGYHIFGNWYLNAERADYYRSLATEVPIWEAPGSYPWAYNGQQIGASADGAVLGLSTQSSALKWSRSSQFPDWAYSYATPGPAFEKVSRSGAIIAAAGNGTLYVLDAATGETLGTETYSEPARLQGIDISADAEVIAVTVYDSCMVFDRNGRRAGIPIGTSNTGTQYAAALSGDGSLLVTGDFYGALKLYRWDGSTYNLRWSAQVGNPWIAGMDISADGSTIACGTGYANGKLCVFDSSSATPVMVYQNYGATGAYVSSVALSDDGSRVAAASWGDIAPSGDFRVFTVHNRNDTTPLVAITRDDEPGSLFACDISADGQFATCGGKAVHAGQMGNGGEVYAVLIGSTPPVNAGVQSVSSPGRFIQVGTQIAPAATVANYGDASADVPVHLVIVDQNDSLLYHDSATVPGVPPRGTSPIGFTPWTPAAFGLYRFQFFTALAGDSVPGDDSLVVAARCYHDARPQLVNPPSAENTINRPFTPAFMLKNEGSYDDAMNCWLLFRDSAGTTVYSESLTSPTIGAGESTTVTFPQWNPANAGRFTAVGVAAAPEDFHPANDSLTKPFAVTYEIMYDDGSFDAFYWVGRQDNDKFYVRFTPTIAPPYSIRHGRIYVNMANTPFDYVMICTGSETKPDTLDPLQIANNVMAPSAPGWAEFDLDVTRPDAGDVWMVAHWPPGSPAMGIGADRNPPLDLRSYFSSNQDTFRLWTTHDWMMRLTQSPEVGLAAATTGQPFCFRLNSVRPNPFSDRAFIQYEVAQTGQVELAVYDRSGRLVDRPVDGVLTPGRYNLSWKACDAMGTPLSPGVYFARLLDRGTGRASVRKVAIVR